VVNNGARRKQRLRKIGIIGNGRFGQLWASILSKNFSVLIYDNKPVLEHTTNSLEEILACDTVFFCVPISSLKQALCATLEPLAKSQHKPLIADVCSLKLYPQQLMEELFPPGQEAMLTHPMFGPDSVNQFGLTGQKIVLDKFRASSDQYERWTSFFSSIGLSVIEMGADEHDRLAAQSLGLVHFVGRTLEEFGFIPTAIDSPNVSRLHEVVSSVTRDSEELFRDMQLLNPHMSEVRTRLSQAQQKLSEKLAIT
jgi:prephenate dehydrogenase